MLDQVMRPDTAALRSLAYRFLAALYLQAPESKWLVSLHRDGLFAEFPVDPTQRMAEGLRLMAAVCAAMETEPELGEAVRADHQQLFVGPGHLPAPPWESVYRSKEQLVFDWPTLEVREAYRSVGLSPALPGEPDDHMGLELLFMGELCQREAEGDTAAAGARLQFLAQHLSQWAPAFCHDVQTNARTPFYQGVALLTQGLLESEQSGR